MKSGPSSSKCLNCGLATGPNFCPHCGQEAEIRQGPLLQVGREVLSDWLSLDSQLLSSLRALLHPGRLSELYVAGKRRPFLRPFRLYLLASLVVFSTLLTLDAPVDTEFTLIIADRVVGEEATGTVQRKLEVLGGDGAVNRWLLDAAGAQVDHLLALPRQEIIERIFSGLRRMLPTTLILFVPFLALGLKLLYLFGKARHTQYLDHLVFALHFQSALFFAMSLGWLITRPLAGKLLIASVVYGVLALVMLLVYLPLAVRRFYGQSWLVTAAKVMLVLFVYSQLLGMAVDLSVLTAIWGM
jgi:hypothetical protein